MNALRRCLSAFVWGAAVTLALPALAREPKAPLQQDPSPGFGTPGAPCSSSTGCHHCISAECVRLYNNGGCSCTVTIQYSISGSSAHTCSTNGTCTYR